MFNYSIAPLLKLSAATRNGVIFFYFNIYVSFPIVVVLPIPLIPTTHKVYGFGVNPYLFNSTCFYIDSIKLLESDFNILEIYYLSIY